MTLWHRSHFKSSVLLKPFAAGRRTSPELVKQPGTSTHMPHKKGVDPDKMLRVPGFFLVVRIHSVTRLQYPGRFDLLDLELNWLLLALPVHVGWVFLCHILQQASRPFSPRNRNLGPKIRSRVTTVDGTSATGFGGADETTLHQCRFAAWVLTSIEFTCHISQN